MKEYEWILGSNNKRESIKIKHTRYYTIIDIEIEEINGKNANIQLNLPRLRRLTNYLNRINKLFNDNQDWILKEDEEIKFLIDKQPLINN